jgi:hypothetical protein
MSNPSDVSDSSPTAIGTNSKTSLSPSARSNHQMMWRGCIRISRGSSQCGLPYGSWRSELVMSCTAALCVSLMIILVRCDENDIWTGQVKDPSIPRATYNTAQKMRASMSHKFGRDCGLGTTQWMENPSVPGRYIGNPSLSVAVLQYMISLRRRKVWVQIDTTTP